MSTLGICDSPEDAIDSGSPLRTNKEHGLPRARLGERWNRHDNRNCWRNCVRALPASSGAARHRDLFARRSPSRSRRSTRDCRVVGWPSAPCMKSLAPALIWHRGRPPCCSSPGCWRAPPGRSFGFLGDAISSRRAWPASGCTRIGSSTQRPATAEPFCWRWKKVFTTQVWQEWSGRSMAV